MKKLNGLGISIIIPCYNAGRYIIETIDSIIAQPFNYPYEIIVVDDGSTDRKTQESLDEIKGKSDISIIRLSENCGAQRARNTALRVAKYDYILAIDADDCLNSDKEILQEGTYTDRAIDILQSRPDVAFVYPATKMFGDFDGLTISAYPVSASLVLAKHHVPTWIVTRKEDVFAAGLYDESIKKWQDWSFAVGLLNARYMSGKKNIIEFLDKPYYLYRIHQRTQRISSLEVDEREVVGITFSKNPNIFRAHYASLSDEQIVDAVYSRKPNRLEDLLYIAAHDLNTALNMAKEREWELVSSNEPENIP